MFFCMYLWRYLQNFHSFFTKKNILDTVPIFRLRIDLYRAADGIDDFISSSQLLSVGTPAPTPPKINMEPQSEGLVQMIFLFKLAFFSGSVLIFGGCIIWSILSNNFAHPDEPAKLIGNFSSDSSILLLCCRMTSEATFPEDVNESRMLSSWPLFHTKPTNISPFQFPWRFFFCHFVGFHSGGATIQRSKWSSWKGPTNEIFF